MSVSQKDDSYSLNTKKGVFQEKENNELKIFELIKKLDVGKGVSWKKLLESTKALTLARDEVEELVEILMDKGLVYEPFLGRLKCIE